VITGLLFASSRFATAGVFDKNRAETQLVIDQSKSVFLRKLRDLCLPIFLHFLARAVAVRLRGLQAAIEA